MKQVGTENSSPTGAMCNNYQHCRSCLTPPPPVRCITPERDTSNANDSPGFAGMCGLRFLAIVLPWKGPQSPAIQGESSTNRKVDRAEDAKNARATDPPRNQPITL